MVQIPGEATLAKAREVVLYDPACTRAAADRTAVITALGTLRLAAVSTAKDRTHLLDHAAVAVGQGSAYGADPYIRVSFATAETALKDAAAAIGAAVATLR